MKATVVAAVLVALAGVAEAYPQFQLARDQTCTSCHLSPAGGNLLNENGLLVAESMSQFGTASEFMYGKIPTPAWLTLGGDLRGATGYLQTPEKVLAAFPMQIELYAALTFGNFSIHANFGPRPATVGNESATRVWAREHYVMWQQNAGGSDGVYVRAGRFMPVFGLRMAEHPLYTRRFGGTALYTDTYGVAVEYVTQKYEAHVTGFIEDPVIDSVEHSNGAAAYGELRLSENMTVGLEGMFADSADDKKIRIGATGKLNLPAQGLLIQGEVQFVNQLVDAADGGPALGAPKGIVGNVMVSRMLTDAVLLDVGIGHYDPNLRIKNLDRDCLDLNVHWFSTSHVELVLNARYELIGFGSGGDAGAYAIAQLHYRL